MAMTPIPPANAAISMGNIGSVVVVVVVVVVLVVVVVVVVVVEVVVVGGVSAASTSHIDTLSINPHSESGSLRWS